MPPFVGMAAQTPPPSRRPRESVRDAMIGSFIRGDEIGRGSFATVYKGIHHKSRALVAIKSVVLSKLNSRLKENLYCEIDILKGLHHPHIVALIDCQESSAHIHLIMEFCALGDLSYFLKKRDTLSNHPALMGMIQKYPNPVGGGLNEVIVRHFLKQLASALQFLRLKNFIHRDIKPQNLLLNPSPLYYTKEKSQLAPYAASEHSLTPAVGIESLPMLKIADFGFARTLPATSLAETLCGSPLYMAPEILRYEKYDAKADLWSVGAVLYEMMVGKPPFRASNHVDLLRKIERQDDRIRFPEDLHMSNDMKSIIKRLLKRHPLERISFKDLFDDAVITGEIPGLVGEDRTATAAVPRVPSGIKLNDKGKETVCPSNQDTDHHANEIEAAGSRHHVRSARASRESLVLQTQERPDSTFRAATDHLARPSSRRQITGRDSPAPFAAVKPVQRAATPHSTRPTVITHAATPAVQELQQAAATNLDRPKSKKDAPPGSPLRQEQTNKTSSRKSSLQEERERAAARDMALVERDYVMVEKKAVEVNAFADEMAASPQIQNAYQYQQSHSHHGAVVRRATTTQGATPNSPTPAHVVPARAVQMATDGRPLHHRQNSYERKLGHTTRATTSAISKALSAASGRLFGLGFSPPLSIGKPGRSPPQIYNPYPTYPTPRAPPYIDDGRVRTSTPLDEDSKILAAVEEAAQISNVVYGFADVKYQQLIPMTPSMDQGLCLRGANVEAAEPVEDDLTVDAILTLSEEALVLYVRAMEILGKAMDIAGSWWVRKTRGEAIMYSSSSPASLKGFATTNPNIGYRINNCVQWVRNRFNEVTDKAEFAREKLKDAQRKLPPDHPSHPNNHPVFSQSFNPTLGTSTENVFVTPGVTAEKLMFERAVDMSRTAAVNELVCEDLPGCELSYITAIQLMEAILASNDQNQTSSVKKNCKVEADKERPLNKPTEMFVNGVSLEDREEIKKMLNSLRKRLADCKKKLDVKKRVPLPNLGSTSSTRATVSPSSNLGTPPK